MLAIAGILLLVTYIGFIIYAVRGGNLMIGYFFMAILWTAIAMVPFDKAVNTVFSAPVEAYGGTIVVICFGSWFGRVLVDTGIAQNLSDKVTVLGKGKPLFASILVCLATTFIFTSAYGVGSVIAIGVILLPILFKLGIPKNIAVTAFTMAIGAGMYVNIVLFKQMQVFVPAVKFDANYLKYGFIAMLVQVAIILIMLIVNAHKFDKNGTDFETAETETGNEKAVQKVNPITYIIPIVPILFIIFLHWDAIPSLVIATILAFLLTGHLKSWKGALSIINSTIQKSIGDIAGLIMMLLALAMFTASATQNTNTLIKLLGGAIPHSTAIIALVIALIAPAALFRGPLNVWGAGSATAAVLSNMHVFDPHFLLPLLYTAVVSMAISTCPTQSWNVWSLDYSKLSVRSYLKTSLVWCWITVAINEAIVVFMFG
ncbi:MAG: gluconate:proton symporter [Sporolactobacillus sp.]|nr:gluconate:proton symporter [Sporolactobacillus sp.]